MVRHYREEPTVIDGEEDYGDACTFREAAERSRPRESNREGRVALDFGGRAVLTSICLHWLNVAVKRIARSGGRSFTVDMRGATRLPTGFFGVLAGWADRGFDVRLLDPEDRVRAMLWFRQYAEQLDERTYRMTDERQEELTYLGCGLSGWDVQGIDLR